MTRFYVELSATLDTDFAHMVAARSGGTEREILAGDEPLFVASDNTLHMSIAVEADTRGEAIDEAVDRYDFELDRLDVPEERIAQPFEVKVVETELMWDNLQASASPGPDDDTGEGLGVLAPAGGPLPSDGVCK